MKITVRHKQDIAGMARIGWIPAGTEKTIEVYVHTDDKGMTPHFHVRKYGRKNKFDWETCVRYDSADYFLHGRYRDKLPDKKVAKELDFMLRQDNSKRRGITYWESAIDDWNNNNSDQQVPSDLEQPDYSKLV